MDGGSWVGSTLLFLALSCCCFALNLYRPQKVFVHVLSLVELLKKEEALYLLVCFPELENVRLYYGLQLSLVRVLVVDHVFQYEHLVMIDLADWYFCKVLYHKTKVFPNVC